MKKRILPLALALLMVIALVPSALAAVQLYKMVEDIGSTFSTTVITQHDYLGEVKIGNLYNLDEPYEASFDVFVVDDSIDKLVTHVYTAERGRDIICKVDSFEWPYLIEDGKVQIAGDTFGASANSKCTIDDPQVFTFTVNYSFGPSSNLGVPYMIACDIYDASSGNFLGQFSVNLIVFTKSQIAEIKQTGKLPPIMTYWGDGEDVSSYLDLSELKSLLFNTTPTPTPTPAPTPAPETTPTPTPTPTPTTAPQAEGTATVANCYFLNVRTGAGVSYNAFASLAKGDVVTVLETKGNWVKVDTAKGQGWVYGEYLER